MASFVHTEYPAQHPGVARLRRSFRWGRTRLHAVRGGRGWAALLLLANMAALVAAAYAVMDTQSDGHLLVLWMLLWLGVFASLAWIAHVQRPARRRLNRQLQAWRAERRQQALDAALWAIASSDARWMQELQAVVDRGADGADHGLHSKPLPPAGDVPLTAHKDR